MRCASSRRKEGEGEAHHGDLGLVHWLGGAGPPKAGVNASPAEGAPGTHEERRFTSFPSGRSGEFGSRERGRSVEGRAGGFGRRGPLLGSRWGVSQAVAEQAKEGRKEARQSFFEEERDQGRPCTGLRKTPGGACGKQPKGFGAQHQTREACYRVPEFIKRVNPARFYTKILVCNSSSRFHSNPG